MAIAGTPGLGICRRCAPMPVLVFTGNVPQTMTNFNDVTWPRTRDTDWCGEYKHG